MTGSLVPLLAQAWPGEVPVVAYVARGAVNSAGNVARTRRMLHRAFELQDAGAGFTFVEIGDILKIGRSTVATYVKNIYQKLEVNSRSEAVFEASSLGVINMPR